MPWTPLHSLAETDAILCGPGMPLEFETRNVDGLVQRVYKGLWPSLRVFWLQAAADYGDAAYVVYEQQRLSYSTMLDLSLKAAYIYRTKYNIRKGDRVAICSRNLPEFLVAFWGCHLLGAVSVLVNAWLPLEPLQHCLLHTGSRIVILDPERAERLLPEVANLRRSGISGFIVIDIYTNMHKWKGMDIWSETIVACEDDYRSVLNKDPGIQPEDNASILFTSGTTGLPKGVLSTQRQYLTNVRNASAATLRARVREGADLFSKDIGTQKGILISVPFFHVAGTTSLTMLATVGGQKIVLMRKWDVEEASRLIRRENVKVAGGVATVVSDLMESSIAGYSFDTFLFGGSPTHEYLPLKAKEIFPNTLMSQTYGLTETNSIAVGIAGQDYLSRPLSTGRPGPVNDVLIMKDSLSVPIGQIGEVWLRGPNIMKGYWDDPDATAKTLTTDGWLKTGDLGLLDAEGFLYIRDRLKDVIIRGGELIDSSSVENALYADPRLLEVVAVGVPDDRLGELCAALVVPKPTFRNQVKEVELIALARKRLPYFAVPVMVLIVNKPFLRTPSGKITKTVLRPVARKEWERRKKGSDNAGICSEEQIFSRL